MGNGWTSVCVCGVWGKEAGGGPWEQKGREGREGRGQRAGRLRTTRTYLVAVNQHPFTPVLYYGVYCTLLTTHTHTHTSSLNNNTMPIDARFRPYIPAACTPVILPNISLEAKKNSQRNRKVAAYRQAEGRQKRALGRNTPRTILLHHTGLKCTIHKRALYTHTYVSATFRRMSFPTALRSTSGGAKKRRCACVCL
ncbi:uncharacterized protein K489DRAFT_197006 [Dissoconium aciculare CBS 342.82]|uniref:Uncharacterized protein n=1 Tax=Dissoconium aciculare CBS 342.82 TaxID=1314786 RepID=A0A6J3M6F2_9PEZI|nr:uncharacterized protein K489DRAFT_197006 [Dissoconium aciculare CBS 342.82]KAF1823478.1 hypothetical protein K489DRAFT_197006 [Dissoconium aciculare CBS 342.82]